MNFFDSTFVAATTSEDDSGSDASTEPEAEDPKQQPKTEDQTEDATEGTKKETIALVSASAAFKEVEGPPDFLDPEAIRPAPVLKERKRRHTTADSDTQPEKKPCPTVIVAKAVTYDTPRDPEATKETQKVASKAMPVDDFLTKGGGAMLPRKTRIQRDKEKLKREKGQSSHSVWKSEDEMLLRQQFDS